MLFATAFSSDNLKVLQPKNTLKTNKKNITNQKKVKSNSENNSKTKKLNDFKTVWK